MSTSRNSIPVHDLTLERFALGELPEADMARIRTLLEQDRLLKKRFDEMAASNDQILSEHTPPEIASAIASRLDSVDRGTPASNVSPLRSMVWVAAAAVLILAVLPVAFRYTTWQDSPITSPHRLKGLRPHLALYRETPDGPERMSAGSVAREGDRIQIVCISAGARFGAIFSVDGRGEVTHHMPVAHRQAVPLTPDRPDTLGFSFALDDAPHWERFYFASSDSPFDVAPLISSALESASSNRAEIASPDAVALHVFTLTKD